MVGISINTLKTRVRLLLRQVGKKYIDELAAELLLAAGKHEKLTCPHAPAISDVGATRGPLSGLKGCRTWQDLAARLPPELLAAAVSDLLVLPRLHSFVRIHGIKSLHEFLSHPALKCGKLTFKNTRSVLGQLMKSPGDVLTPYELPDKGSAAQAFAERLNILTPRQREIIEARSGVNGVTETLLQIGTRMGCSRARIRQIEREAVLKLSSHGFANAIEARVREIWHGQVVPLDDASVSWLGGNGKQDPFVIFVLDHFVSPSHRPHLAQAWGRTYLTPLSQGVFDSEVQPGEAAIGAHASRFRVNRAGAMAPVERTPMTAKKKNSKGNKGITKSGFIRTLADNTPAKEVVAKAKEAGLELDEKRVWTVQSEMRAKAKGAKPASATVGAASPASTTMTSKPKANKAKKGKKKSNAAKPAAVATAAVKPATRTPSATNAAEQKMKAIIVELGTTRADEIYRSVRTQLSVIVGQA